MGLSFRTRGLATLLEFCLTAHLLVAFLGTASGQARAPSDDCLACLCHSKTAVFSTPTNDKLCHFDVPCTDSLSFGELCGGFGMSETYWRRAGSNVINKDHKNAVGAFHRCVNDTICSSSTVTTYMLTYGEDCDRDGVVSCRDYAAINILAPYGLNCPNDDQFWIYQSEEFQYYESCARKLSVV